METKHSVYNVTRGSLLSVAVTTVDTTQVTLPILKKQIESVARNANTGIWLTPFRGIPAEKGRSSFDLVYLDQDLRVIHGVGLFNTVEFEPIEGHASSALALPSHTISRSQTSPGDQLIILAAEETERRLRHAFDSTMSVPVDEGLGTPVEHALCDSGLHSSPAGNGIQTSQAAIRTLDKGFPPAAATDLSLKGRFLRWLHPHRDRRGAFRHPLPGLVAYYWTGGAPRPQMIGDISVDGFYLLTEERWTPGTVILMTLQRAETAADANVAISLLSRVVRSGTDGVGFEFVPSECGSSKDLSSRRVFRTQIGAVEGFLSALNLSSRDKKE